jgi:hypothetical protein
MGSFTLEDLSITLDREGARRYTKVTYPVRYGRFAEIRTRKHTFQFNPSGEIKSIQGRPPHWPGANEWLKRTTADDWVYYAADGYNLIHTLTGEHYRPCFAYPSNSVFQDDPLESGVADFALAALGDVLAKLEASSDLMAPDVTAFAELATGRNRPSALAARARRFHELTRGSIPVLPPDARHVDYEVIPLCLAEGCRYRCGFCTVKSGHGFSLRSREQITEQIAGLKEFYGPDLGNYNSVFLGQNDALLAGRELIEFAARSAYEMLGLENSNMKGSCLFLFGSIDALQRSDDALLAALGRLPYYTYINVGLESADQQTLDALQKPVSAAAVRGAFFRMLEINERYEKIEVTANFVIGDGLPRDHLPSILELAGSGPARTCVKGGLYLSPLMGSKDRRALKRTFLELKTRSRVPTYLYQIQRL